MDVGYYAMTTLGGICQSGGFPGVYVYHICGMPWASTNNPDFKTWLDTDSADPIQMRKYLFGETESHTAGQYASNDVQVLVNLSGDIGPQTVSYGQDKGLDVGPWNVKLTGTDGFKWDFAKMGGYSDHGGLLGVDWQPSIQTVGSVHSILAADFDPEETTTRQGFLYWPQNKDFGLKDFLDGQWGISNDNPGFLWTSQTCMVAIGQTSSSGSNYVVNCRSCQFNAPNELVFRSIGGQNVFITNYPQGIAGLTANTFAVNFIDGAVVE